MQKELKQAASPRSSAGKGKLFKPSKTVMFDDYAGRGKKGIFCKPNIEKDLNPNDILLETDKIVSDTAANTKKVIVNKSTDTSMIKGETDHVPTLTNLNLRYDRDFFHKHIMNVSLKE